MGFDEAPRCSRTLARRSLKRPVGSSGQRGSGPAGGGGRSGWAGVGTRQRRVAGLAELRGLAVGRAEAAAGALAAALPVAVATEAVPRSEVGGSLTRCSQAQLSSKTTAAKRTIMLPHQAMRALEHDVVRLPTVVATATKSRRARAWTGLRLAKRLNSGMAQKKHAIFLFALGGSACLGVGCEATVNTSASDSSSLASSSSYVFVDTSSSTGMPMSDDDGSLPDPYDDPGCPDAPPPIEAFDCDPYKQGNGDCPPGEGCYIYVDYPDAPCEQEIYGSMCRPAGSGQQGEGCGSGLGCAGGFACVITGSGTQCVQLCSLNGPSGCPAGLVCEPIDVKGFGGCL